MNLEVANSRGLGTEAPQRGHGAPEADDFSQLKGYLDVTSGILGAWPLAPPKSASARYSSLQPTLRPRREYQYSHGRRTSAAETPSPTSPNQTNPVHGSTQSIDNSAVTLTTPTSSNSKK